MTPSERHAQYVGDLTDLAQSEGEAMSTDVLGAIETLFDRSKGNIEAAVTLVEEAKEIIDAELVRRAKIARTKAMVLGHGFGRSKEEQS